MNRFLLQSIFVVMSSYSMYSMEKSIKICFLELIGDGVFQTSSNKRHNFPYSLKNSDLDANKGKVLELLRNVILKMFPDKLIKIYHVCYDTKNGVFGNKTDTIKNLTDELDDTLDSSVEDLIRKALENCKGVTVFFHPFDKPADIKKKTSPVVDNVKSKVDKKKTSPVVDDGKYKVNKKETNPVIGDIKGKDGEKKTGTAVRDGKENTTNKKAGTSNGKKCCC